MSQRVYFIDELTLWSWWTRILPFLRRKGYAFECSKRTFPLIRFLARLGGGSFERLSFRLLDIRDEEGVLLRLRIPSQDLLEVQGEILKNPALQAFLSQCAGMDRLSTYLAKAIPSYHLLESGTLWRTLQMIQVCVWKMRERGLAGQAALFFLKGQPFFEAIQAYGLRHGISVVRLAPSFELGKFLRRLLGPERIYRLICLQAFLFKKKVHFQKKPMGGPKIAVEYRGNLHLNQPERHSDLFFWKPSTLPASDFLVTFHPGFLLDEEKWKELNQVGMAAVAVHPRSVASSKVPFFPFRRGRGNGPLWPERPRSSLKGLESRWLKEHVSRYLFLRSFWQEFFASNEIKVSVSWFKYTSEHCAIADGLQAAGGVSVIYQRAYESHPSIETTTAVDVVFGFSPLIAELERRSYSVIRYHVTTGYLGDHRFPLVREEAFRIRQRLREHGARRIVSFTDENSADDVRWHTGHGLQQEHYAFLLEKVLSEPWLGLVIKPKIPSTLRKRLGPVVKLLEEAQKTGRCFLFEEGGIFSATPPATAALASDLMIQGHLCAGTTGMESALAGVPTLLLDREGWPLSPLYRLGPGQVVFTDWPSLWKKCMEHWTRPGGVPGFGDWSGMLDELDPFRDGRAAERMGTYLRWLLEGFQRGLDREEVMADAAERYTALWGRDKVRQVNVPSERDLPQEVLF